MIDTKDGQEKFIHHLSSQCHTFLHKQNTKCDKAYWYPDNTFPANYNKLYKHRYIDFD